ncbi:MAG: response regulator transcription factor [Candidatus Binatus sp.]|uniref:LuxR C-terminal-related transcriptional regulator n=1 Tax=Candidatus Binatus sp. TaxID=2811406 RepID=UPI002724AD95|nr:response regulator transcription factor [Candidatus Binatus sp.]MDO8434203.1 response regulator transcription factor [Candidatus Binatus sp.]
MQTSIRLIIADDHALFRQGLKSLLLLEPDIKVVAEVERASDVQAVVAANPCDILLLDLQMERWSMQDIPQLARLTKVVVLTASESAENGVSALRLGARGIIQKRFAIETLMTALRTVADGLVWMPTNVQTEFARQETSTGRQLTPRESEIIRYVASGLRNAEVGERLAISESTVKTHLNNIFQKLGLRDRLELTHYAIKTGIVPVLNRDR